MPWKGARVTSTCDMTTKSNQPCSRNMHLSFQIVLFMDQPSGSRQYSTLHAEHYSDVSEGGDSHPSDPKKYLEIASLLYHTSSLNELKLIKLKLEKK